MLVGVGDQEPASWPWTADGFDFDYVELVSVVVVAARAELLLDGSGQIQALRLEHQSFEHLQKYQLVSYVERATCYHLSDGVNDHRGGLLNVSVFDDGVLNHGPRHHLRDVVVSDQTISLLQLPLDVSKLLEDHLTWHEHEPNHLVVAPMILKSPLVPGELVAMLV